MGDEDSNSGFEFVFSQPERRQFEELPEEIIFEFKIQTSDGPRKVSYKLKEGTALPYRTAITGISLRYM